MRVPVGQRPAPRPRPGSAAGRARHERLVERSGRTETETSQEPQGGELPVSTVPSALHQPLQSQDSHARQALQRRRHPPVPYMSEENA